MYYLLSVFLDAVPMTKSYLGVSSKEYEFLQTSLLWNFGFVASIQLWLHFLLPC